MQGLLLILNFESFISSSIKSSLIKLIINYRLHNLSCDSEIVLCVALKSLKGIPLSITQRQCCQCTGHCCFYQDKAINANSNHYVLKAVPHSSHNQGMIIESGTYHACEQTGGKFYAATWLFKSQELGKIFVSSKENRSLSKNVKMWLNTHTQTHIYMRVCVSHILCWTFGMHLLAASVPQNEAMASDSLLVRALCLTFRSRED